MKHILGRDQRAVLHALAGTRALLAFDFDGTLAPIVPRPRLARMRQGTRSLLSEAARLYKCAVITGRSLGDLRSRVAGLPLWAIVGNHGAEDGAGWPGQGRARRTVRVWRRVLRDHLHPMRGVWVEDKMYTLTIHFRGASDPARAKGAVLRVARFLPGARLVEGHFGLNLLPAAAPHKGIAIRRLCRRARSESALYVGDDGSDELVFSSPPGGRFVTVRVGRSRSSRAAYYLRDQREIDELLATLIELRGRRRSDLRKGFSPAAARMR